MSMGGTFKRLGDAARARSKDMSNSEWAAGQARESKSKGLVNSEQNFKTLKHTWDKGGRYNKGAD
jgi:hypothetical protein